MSMTRRKLLDDSYKRTAEGNPAIAEGSLSRLYPKIIMQGWTEQKSYTGKNLLPIDAGELFSNTSGDTGVFGEDGVTVTFNDVQSGERKDLYLFGDGVNVNSESSYVDISELTPGDYHICNDNLNILFYVVVWRDGTSVVLGYSNTKTTPITIEEGDKFRIFFACHNPIDGIQEYTIHPMLVKDGGNLTTYEPYTGGKPSPSPEYPQPITSAGKYNEEAQKYEYQVKLTGKNLWNAEEAAETSKWVVSTSQRGYSDFAIEVETGKKITISTDEVKPTGLGYYIGVVLEENGSITHWLYHDSAESLINEKATVTSLSNKIWIRCATATILNDFIPNNPYFQVEYGEEKSDYEPYRTPQTVTLTSDRPLTKWDRLVYMDGQWQWEYGGKNIVFNGSENWAITGEVNDNFAGFALRSDEYNAKRYSVMSVCDKLPYSLSSKPNTQKQVDDTYGLRFYIGYSELPNQTVVEFKKYLENNPVKFIYQLSDSEYAPLQQSEQTALNALYTFRPTTVLSNDCDCNMSLTYKTKKSMGG